MTRKNLNCVAIDCGNSSVRIVLGTFDGSSFHTTPVARHEHREILVNGVWHWDILFMFERIKEGLKKAFSLCGRIDSAGIATWGIDHGLVGDNGLLLANPFCYRNVFGQSGLSRLDAAERRFMFDMTGIQCDKINSVFQILGYRERYPAYWQAARKFLLIPDLLNFLLTGEMNSDPTIASTTQLYDVKNHRYAERIFAKFAIDPDLFPPTVAHGEVRGTLLRTLADEIGVKPFPVVSVPSHDTAAAVAAIPGGGGPGPLFISSGTWSLIGVELARPLLNDAVYAAGLANEAGILGTTTLLRNSAGLYIAQRLKLECDLTRPGLTWNDIVAGIDRRGDCGLIDPNAEEFFNPPSMRDAIAQALQRSGAAVPGDDAGFFRVVYESLGRSYRDAICGLEAVTGTVFPAVNIIGGGSKNRLLNQITADLTGKRVVAGPAEATSLGTLGAQLLYAGAAQDLPDIRRIMAASAEAEVFEPAGR